MTRVALLAAAVAGTGVLLAPPAAAVDDSLGTPGFCPGGDGVTVVVDFQQLGGTPIVRCAPGDEPRTGLEALQDAGFQVEGTQRWGDAFVCRVEARPAAAEELPVEGAEGYRESCVDTPPTGAYWSYWQAEDGGAWSYSAEGAASQQAASGGFEGWSFALNETQGSAPAPGVAPDLPDEPEAPDPGPGPGTGGTGGTGPGANPDGGEPDGGVPGSTGAGPSSGPGDGDGVGAPLPVPQPEDGAGGPGVSTRTEPPPDQPTWTGGQAQPAGTAEPGSPTSALVGLGVAALLALAAGAFAWRRRRSLT